MLTAAIFDLICFFRASSLAFLILLNFLFTRGYFISTQVQIFHIITIFLTRYAELKLLTRVENLHIIGPLVNANKNVTELLLTLMLAEKGRVQVFMEKQYLVLGWISTLQKKEEIYSYGKGLTSYNQNPK